MMCVEFECKANDGHGDCIRLMECGGSDRVFCSFYENPNTRAKCDTCLFAVAREGKNMKLCIYRDKIIPPKKSACPHYSEAL